MAITRVIPDPLWPQNRELLLARLSIIPKNIQNPVAMMRYLETDHLLAPRIRANYPDRFTAKGTISIWCKTFCLDFRRTCDAIARTPYMVKGGLSPVETFRTLIRELMSYEV